MSLVRIKFYIPAAVFAIQILACGVSTPSSDVPTGQPTEAAHPPTATTQTTLEVERVFIQLVDPLDEPEFYCMDVPGAGGGVRLDSDLQAHTCKPITTAADELFTMDHPKEGQIYMEAYDLCVEAEGARKGSPLRLQPCSNSHHQFFALEDGVIRLRDRDRVALCLAVAPGSGIPTGGPSHLRRALTLEDCDTIDPTLIRWSVGLFDY